MDVGALRLEAAQSRGSVRRSVDFAKTSRLQPFLRAAGCRSLISAVSAVSDKSMDHAVHMSLTVGTSTVGTSMVDFGPGVFQGMTNDDAQDAWEFASSTRHMAPPTEPCNSAMRMDESTSSIHGTITASTDAAALSYDERIISDRIASGSSASSSVASDPSNPAGGVGRHGGLSPGKNVLVGGRMGGGGRQPSQRSLPPEGISLRQPSQALRDAPSKTTDRGETDSLTLSEPFLDAPLSPTSSSSLVSSPSSGSGGFFYESLDHQMLDPFQVISEDEDAEENDVIQGDCSTLTPDARKALTVDICSCSDWRELRDLIEVHSSAMDCIHVSAAFVRLAKIASATAAALPMSQPLSADPDAVSADRMMSIDGVSALVNDLCGLLSTRSRAMGSRQISNIMWSLASLMPALRALDSLDGPRARSMTSLHPPLSARRSFSHQLTLPDVAQSNVATALKAAQVTARKLALSLQGHLRPLDMAPSSEGRSAPLTGTGEVENGADLRAMSIKAPVSPQALANALWSMARMGLRPNDAWFGDYLECSMSRLRGQGSGRGFNIQELSSMLWSMASLRLWPGERWAAAAAIAVGEAMDGGGATVGSSSAVGPQAVSNILWAFAKLKVRLFFRLD